MNDETKLLAIFGWHLHLDAAFLRSQLSMGFKTMEDAFKSYAPSAVETGVTRACRKIVKQWTQAHRRFDKSFTEKDLLNPKRWAVFAYSAEPNSLTTPTNIEELLKIYEGWMWHITHKFISDTNPKTPLFKALRAAYLWQVQCESSHAHMRIHLFDFDRLEREGKRLSADQLRARAYVAGLPTCYEDHPMYPQALLGRLRDDRPSQKKKSRK